MTDLIDRQAVLGKLKKLYVIEPVATADFGWNVAIDHMTIMVEDLPSAQPTLYGYSIEHLVLIARVMQKENVTPEKAIECFKDLGRIVQMITDEQQEMIRSVVEKWTI